MFIFSFSRSLCEFLTALVRRRLEKRQSHILRQNSKHLSVIKKDNQRILKERKRTRDKKMDEYAVLFGLFSAVKQHAPTTTTKKKTQKKHQTSLFSLSIAESVRFPCAGGQSSNYLNELNEFLCLTLSK